MSRLNPIRTLFSVKKMGFEHKVRLGSFIVSTKQTSAIQYYSFSKTIHGFCEVHKHFGKPKQYSQTKR